MKNLILFIWAGLLLVIASFATYYELRPFIGAGSDRNARYQAYAESRRSSGLSTFSKDVILRDCLSVVTSIHGRMQSEAHRKKVMHNCQNEVKNITRYTPTHSFAWFTQALIASELSEVGKMNEGLNNSRLTGPNEQWIAEVRVELSEKNYSKLNPINVAGNDQDLLMLVKSRRGVKTIARRYIQKPEFRARIATLVEELTEENQLQFVNNVRRAARNMGLI
ncbi:MAG: hypothetical protein GY761_05320 [Hyphomicrobiales bacterium]|nr:hypothetical protein [Hyphomicrobiales bacterium]